MTRTIPILLTLFLAAPAFGQFKDVEPGGQKTGPAQTHQWKAGIIITASAGPCRGSSGYVPVPMDWPEQTVKIVNEDVSPGVKIGYQTVNDSAKLMTIGVPWLGNGETAKAVVTFECARTMQLPPTDKSGYTMPVAKKLSPELRRYLGASPGIETPNKAIRQAAKDVGTNAKTAWEHVEAIYDWERTKVKYESGIESKGAAAALKNGKANHDDMAALFVAVCRDADVPARMVWVPEFCYAEFYLIDKQGEGQWLPCSPAGVKAFGEMQDTKLILFKGDNFRLPDVHDRQRLARPNFIAHPGTPKAGKPNLQWVGQQVN